ncbi:MAG TPA: aspartate aminotransferase family protein [Bacteroidales bacterium]|nr:aspartate aminotransferase family protein [Bacteroidales bacterium]
MKFQINLANYMTLSNRELFIRYLGQTSENPYLLEIERAEGVFLYDTAGKKYFDLISGVSVSSLGHNCKNIKDSINEQVEKHLHLMVYGEYIQSPQVKLAEYICGLLPESINSVYFVNSGSEAIEGAIKLAKRYTAGTKMFSFRNAYHGSSHGALSLCGNEEFKNSFRPLLPEVYILDFNDYSQLDLIDKNTACVVFEPIQAEAGVIIPDGKYIKTLKQVCEKNNCLLIADEIQTGFGRTGKMFGFEHFEIVPDIVCFAKALGGGMPIGAFAASRDIMKSFTSNPVLGHITTFGGHPVCSAAALSTIKFINESGLVNDVYRKEKLFRKFLVHSKISEIRGRGLLLAIELNESTDVYKFIKQGLIEGFVTDWFIFHDSAFRIAPPLNITDDEIKMSCELIKSALNKI